MEDRVLMLGAAVERTYACPARLVLTTSVNLGGERRVVLGFEIRLHEHTEVCFAWSEPTAHGHPCVVLRTEDFRTPEAAVRAVVGERPVQQLAARSRVIGPTLTQFG